jgi:hypothetical protein
VNKKRIVVPLALLLAGRAGPAAQTAARLAVGADDSLQVVLSRHVGKQVTLKLDSGEELTGTVRVAGRTVHLEQLSGREFFDAAVDVEEVAAVVVRVR